MIKSELLAILYIAVFSLAAETTPNKETLCSEPSCAKSQDEHADLSLLPESKSTAPLHRPTDKHSTMAIHASSPHNEGSRGGFKILQLHGKDVPPHLSGAPLRLCPFPWCKSQRTHNLHEDALNKCSHIGDTCQDGSVYAGQTSDGRSNLFTTPTDAPKAMGWGRFGEAAGATSANNGALNTAKLARRSSALHPAARYCSELTSHTRNDWYLPSSEEMNVLLKNAIIIGRFNSSFYWTSTERDMHNADVYFLQNGKKYGDFKTAKYAVRCIRKESVAPSPNKP